MDDKNVNVYWLCEQWQDKKDGRRIETTLDMNSFKDFDSFMKALKKSKTITEEEFQKYSSAYYD